MIPRKLKTCKCGCGKEGYIWARGYLKGHEPVKQKQLKRTPLKKKFPEPTGELVLFQAIWAARPHVCTVCDKPLKDFMVHYFSHILAKKPFPSYMLYDKNIDIQCWEYDGTGCHSKWEHRTAEMRTDPKWIPVFEKHDRLKELYYNK